MATLAEDPVETYFVKFECSIGANALVNHWAPFDSDMLNYLSQDNYREGLTLTTLNTAIELAENGFEVFTLKPDGKPYTENGFKNATRDPNLIMEAWEKHPDALIGVFTGASGVIVLDLDYKVVFRKEINPGGFSSELSSSVRSSSVSNSLTSDSVFTATSGHGQKTS